MRKRVFLTLVLSLCMANFGAFAANPRGNARGVAAANNAPSATASSTVSARAATRNTAAVAPKTNTAPVSARAAVRNTPKVAATASAASPVKAARAASTQKVINNGTKVATAATNTVIDQECQNAFYGCMDSFCMIDNASGGRCQCSNRNAELTSVMDDIAKLDEQSYLMATEGVERIQMGESADQIIARAKAAGDQAVGKTPTTSNAANNQKKVRTLDLSAWNTNIFSEDEDIFDDVDVSVDASAVSDALSKTGDALYTDAAKMCIAQMPAKCNASVKMLQSVYAQKIKSDCIAFENSLKQQKIASTQKLQAAEKALRDAALDEFKDKNKYSLGGCVQEYARCMQNECGNDYSKCITLSAQENMMGGAGKVKDRTINGVVPIVLSGSTMNQLLSKKTICDDEVLVHCENYRAQVWDKYIEGAATALKSAELNAEDDARQNCIKNVADCFRNSCATQWNPESDAKNYDMCLSEPMLLYDSCKIRVESCIVATGGSVSDAQNRTTLKKSRLWMGVESMLAALRVDACTKEVKAGIEAICGKDFSYCVGLNPGSIADLLPTDTLTACKEENKDDPDKIYKYISDIAQGYALQINDALYARCENAAKEAMISVCGNSENCESLDLGNISFDGLLKVQLCGKDKESDEKETCSDSANDFSKSAIVMGRVTPHIVNRFNVNGIEYTKLDAAGKKLPADKYTKLGKDAKKSTANDATYGFYYDATLNDLKGDYATPGDPQIKAIISGLNNLLKTKIETMKQNKVVKDCMEGKDVTGFRSEGNKDKTGNSVVSRNKINNGKDAGNEYTQDAIFTNLLNSYTQTLADKTLALLRQRYAQAEKDLQPQLDAATDKISERLASIEGLEAEAVHQQNENNCALFALDKNMETNNHNCNCGDDDVNFSLPYPAANSKLSESDTRATSGRCNGYARDPKNKQNIKMCGCYRKWDGFCQPGDRWFFKTGEGRNYNGQLLKHTTYAYDRATSTCTLTTRDYKCTNYLSPYCWSWDETGVVSGTPEVRKMPTLNKEDVIDKYKDENVNNDNDNE